jgi:hypothetical protein
MRNLFLPAISDLRVLRFGLIYKVGLGTVLSSYFYRHIAQSSGLSMYNYLVNLTCLFKQNPDTFYCSFYLH